MPIGMYRRTKAPWNKGKKTGPLSKEHRKKIKLASIRNGNKPPTLTGVNNPGWKGDNATYVSIHCYISYHRGKPDFCEHCGRKDLPHRSYHWANKSHEYKRDLDDWIRLCAKCHSKYDRKNL